MVVSESIILWTLTAAARLNCILARKFLIRNDGGNREQGENYLQFIPNSQLEPKAEGDVYRSRAPALSLGCLKGFCQFADSLSIETRISIDIHAPHPDFSHKS